MRVRFAPSPTGHLHVGNARTALFNWLLARGARRHVHPPHRGHRRRAIDARVGGGHPRDLRWLGLDWDEGPDVGGARGPYRQSERLHLYQSYAKELLDRRTRRTTASARPSSSRPSARRRSPPGGRRATRARCRRLSREQAAARIAAGERPAIRFRVPEDRDVVFTDVVRGEVRFHTDVIGDPVIVRADGHPGLQLRRRRRRCADGDDACDPRRGSHLEHAAADAAVRGARVHAAGVRAPGAGDGARSQPAVEAARRDVGRRVPGEGLSAGGAGQLPGADRLVARATTTSCCRSTSWRGGSRSTRVGHSAGVFDEEKLAWVNRHYLKMADPARLAELSLPYFDEAGVRDDARRPRPASSWRRRCRWRRASVDRLDQVPARLAFLFDYDADAALARSRSVREEMRGGSGARASCARSPTSWRRRRGSIASDSARWRIEVKAQNRAEGEGAVSSDPGRADRPRRGTGARSGGAGDRSRRGPAASRPASRRFSAAASARPRSSARSTLESRRPSDR